MKYLKLFEEYLDPTNEILCDIEDMCLELKDDGCSVFIKKIKNKKTSYTLTIDRHNIYYDYIPFKYELVKDIIIRILNYVSVEKLMISRKHGLLNGFPCEYKIIDNELVPEFSGKNNFNTQYVKDTNWSLDGADIICVEIKFKLK